MGCERSNAGDRAWRSQRLRGKKKLLESFTGAQARGQILSTRAT
jgi:hypothetical protein